MAFVSCSKKKEATEESNVKAEQVDDLDQYSDITYEDEDEESTLNKVKKDIKKFYGTWVAKSGKAEYLYGSVEITVNEDGTWSGIITDEQLGGKYEEDGDTLHMNDDLFSFDLAFSSSGSLVMIEDNDGELIKTVLTKK